MGAGIAGCQHTEHDAESDTVEAGANQVVVAQDEQAKYAEVHQEHVGAQGAADAGHPFAGGDKIPILFWRAAHEQCHRNGDAVNRDAEHIGKHPGSDLQRLTGKGAGKGHAQGLEQHCLGHKRNHAHRQRRAVQVKALVNSGRVGKTRGNQEADEEAHHNGQNAPQQVEPHHLRAGIADQQVGNQGGNTGGKEHGGNTALEGLLFHRAVQHSAQDGGPDVQNVDAPGAKAHGQDTGQGGNGIHFRPKNHIEPQAQKAHQSHVQQGSGVAADGEAVARDLAGLAQDSSQTGQHIRPVRHKESGNEERCGESPHNPFEEVAF